MAPNTSLVLGTFDPELENSESFVRSHGVLFQSEILQVLVSEV